MLKKFEDIVFPEKSIYSPQEEKFKEKIKATCGVDVKQTLFTKVDDGRGILRLWVAEKPGEYVGGYACNETIGNYKKDDVMAFYCESFGIPNEFSSVELYVYGFFNSLVGYAYGHAMLEIKAMAAKKYRCNEMWVLLDLNLMGFVIDAPAPICSYLEKKMPSFKQDCLKLLKQYDYYDVLKESDVRIELVVQGTRNLNDLHMVNR